MHLRGDARRGVRRAQRRPVARLEPGLLEQLPLGRGLGAPPPRRPAARPAARAPLPAGWRYWRRQSTRSSSSTARTTTAPGCSRTTRVNGSSVGAVRAAGPGPRAARTGAAPVEVLAALDRPALRDVLRLGVHPADVTVPVMTDSTLPSASRQPDRAGGRERAALIEVDRYDIDVDVREPPGRPALVATSSITFQLPDAGRGDVRRHRRRGGLGPAQRRRARPVDARGRTAAAPVTRRRERARRLLGPDRHRLRATRSCAASTRRTSSSTSGRRSSRTAPGGHGPASTSPTSRPCTASRSARPRSGRCSATARPRSCSTATTAAGCGSSRTPRGSRRTSSWSTPARSTSCARSGRPQPGPLLPAVAAVLPRAGRRGPLPGHRAGAGVLRGAVRPAVPAGALRPGLRARLRGRDGELGLRHLDRQRAVANAADARQARAGRRLPPARDGAHVVRRPGDDALVGRPVAQRGVRLVRIHLGSGVGDRVHRRLGHLPRGRADRRLPAGPGAGHPSDPRQRARRGPRLRDLRRDHLLQGRGGAAPADGAGDRGEVRRGAAQLLRGARVGQRRAGRPDAVDRRRRRPGPDGVDQRLAGPLRHRHDQPGRDHAARVQPGRR